MLAVWQYEHSRNAPKQNKTFSRDHTEWADRAAISILFIESLSVSEAAANV